MTPERRKLARRAFEKALKLAPAQRSAYIEETCADDAELRAEVESLLTSHEAAHATEADTSPRRQSKRSRAKSDTLPEIVPGRTTLGAYNVLEKLGSGGMGTIYLAKDARLGRRVALKILPAHFARDEEFVRRFEQEARAASSLNHPNIITVHEIGEAEGRRFIVTELVEGRTLREAIAESPLSVREALEVCAQVAGALAKAHGAGIVHRDVKPENVMVDEEGHVKVLDFGIAKRLQQAVEVSTEAPTSAQNVNTAAGVVLGTSTYMSPEQLRGQDLDARTDIWSLGVLLYEALAGRPPFHASNYGDLVVSILHSRPTPLSDFREDLPEGLEEILRRSLAKERDERFASAKELQAELRRLARRLALEDDSPRTNVSTLTPRAGAEEREAARLRSVPTMQQGAAPLLTTPPPLMTEQRKQVTVLFADFSGLASLAEGDAEEDSSELLGELWPLVDGVVEEYGGSVDKHVGDTLVALWGSRAAREDDPERAVRAALAMRRAVADFAAERLTLSLDADASDEAAPDAQGREGAQPAQAGAPLMRAGVSTGRALLGEVGATGELTVTGDAVRTASRLQQAAPPGSVLLSHDTYRHVRGVFSVHPPEALATEMRGAEAVQFYRVKRAKPRAFRVDTRGVEGVETCMIGRKAELRRLTDTVESVFEDGELQAVTVVAEAGLGKSRLLYELVNWVELLPDIWYVFNGRATESTQGLPYALVRDVFAFRFEIQDSDSPQVAREKLERGMLAMCKGVPEAELRMRAHFLGQLIGFDYSASPHVSGIRDDAQQIRDRAFHYAAQFFADIARARPLVLYLDDIHWADEGSLDFIDYISRNCADSPVMILCLARPALLERRPSWGEGRERHTRLSLQPLSKKESRQLVEEILKRVRGVPPNLREMVVGSAEGNPFYVEELIKVLIDQKVIVTGADEWSVDASRLGEVKVPPTLTGVLEARLDKLTPQEKGVIQRASVIGRIFWGGAVEHLGAGATTPNKRATVGNPASGPSAVSAGVAEILESLRRKELIYHREASAFAGAREYIFKHALLRDVAYESVLKRDRRVYHRRAAEWLARRSGGRVGEYAGLIAEHYDRAQSAEDAAEWYGRAGRQARETHAPESAIGFYRKALAFSSVVERSEEADALAFQALRMEWYEGLGEVLRVQARHNEAIEAYQSMRAAAEALNAPAAQARAWNEMALVQNSQGDNRAAAESTRRAEKLSRAEGRGPGARVELARALNLQSQASSRLGDARSAMMLADRALSLVDEMGDAGRRVRADCLKSLGMAYHMLGRFEQAEEFKAQALELFREMGDRRSVGNLLNSLGETARLSGDYRDAFERYQEALAIAREIANRNGEILYFSNLGGTRVGLGQYAEAEADLRQTIEMGEAAGYVGLSENFRFLAEALVGQDRLEEAMAAARRALELGREIDNQEHVAEAWRALGLVASRASKSVEYDGRELDATDCFTESLTIFTSIQMEAERARTLRDWARHELQRGDRDRGQKLWREALEAFRRLSMTLELERMSAEP
jgi:serine/threonine protein kinase/tetratricopeptide (TPR) repeat protein